MPGRHRRLLLPALALAADLVLGEPPAWAHPVVWVGRAIGLLERIAPADQRPRLFYGTLAVGGTVGVAGAFAWAAERYAARWNFVRLVLAAYLLKSCFSLRGLARAAKAVQEALESDDLPRARGALRSLVSRDVSELPGPLLAAAAVESVAENASDSVVAPLMWYAIGGLPAACMYRTANTFDSMWGYRGRYEHLGKTAALLDDLANLVPARVTGCSIAVAAPLVGGSAVGAWSTMWRDHGRTASPNAGWPMSAMAGTLGTKLEKVGHYRIGDGRAPDPATIGSAVRLLYVSALLPLIAAGILMVRRDARH